MRLSSEKTRFQAFPFTKCISCRYAAVHLRLALPHVRAALRQLRDSCRVHVSKNAASSSAVSSAAVAVELSALAEALMVGLGPALPGVSVC